MNEREKQDLIQALIEILRNDREVRKAVQDAVLACPNIMVQY